MTGPSSASATGQLLEYRLSPERLNPYRAASGGGLDEALELYEWNARAASAFALVIGHFEVILRNALDQELAAWHSAKRRPGRWYDDPNSLLAQHRQGDIAEARKRIKSRKKTETPGRVVAELMFGFWRQLLEARYETILWAQALRHAFPHLRPQRRLDVAQPVGDIYTLRNRVAHHEPIHALDLGLRHHQVMTVVSYIDPQLETWLQSKSEVLTVLAARP